MARGRAAKLAVRYQRHVASKSVTAAMARELMHSGKIKPAVEFFLYPEGPRNEIHGKNAFQVTVYRASKDLQVARKAYWPRRKPAPVWAFTKEFRRRGKFLIGAICLYRESVTDNVVAHEIFHASLWWANRMGFDPEEVMDWGSATHERVAEAHGNMVSQFWMKFTEAGFERKECWGLRPARS